MDTTRIVLRATARLYQRISAQLILIAAFVGLVWFLLYFTINSSYAVKLFDGIVNTRFRGRIMWTRIMWGPMPWQLQILEPALIGAHDRPIITADAVRIGVIRLDALVGGRISAADITIDRPVVRLTGREHPEALDAFGRPEIALDLPQMFWPPGPLYDDGQPGGPPPLDFEGVAIHDATFVLDMPFVAVVAEDIDVREARFQLTPGEAGPVIQIGARELQFARGGVRVQREGERPPIDAPDAEVLSFPVSDVRVDHFRWQGERFTVARLGAEHRGDRLLVSNYRMRLDTPGTPYMGAKVQLAVQDVARHLAQFGVDLVRGPAVLTVEGEGPIDAFEGTVTAAGDGLLVGPLRFDRYVLTARKSADDRVALEAAEVSAWGGRVTVEGGVDLPTGRAWAEVWPRRIDVTRLPVSLDPQLRLLLAGGLSGPIFVHVADLFDEDRAITASADLRLERRGRPIFGVGARSGLRLDARLRGPDLELRRLDFESGGTALDARGDLDLYALDAALSGHLTVAEPGPALAELGLPITGGRVAVDWRLSGALDDPRVRARLDARNVRYDAFPGLDLAGRLDYAKGWLELSDFVIDPRDRADPDARVGVRGRIGVARPGIPLDLDVNARRVDLDPLPLGDIGGRVDLIAEIEGSARRPRGTVKARVVDPRWQALELRRLDVAGGYDGRKATLEALSLYGDGARPLVRASGAFEPGEGAYSLDVALDRVPLALVEQIAPPETPRDPDDPYPLRGEISANLKGEGRLDAPALDGAVQVHGLGYDVYDLGDGTLDVQAAGQGLRVAGRLFDRFDVEVDVPTVDDGRPAVATVRFADLAVEGLLPQLRDVPLETKLTGRVTAQVAPFAGELQQVTAELTGLEARYTLDGDRFLVAAPFPVELAFDGRVVDVRALTLTAVYALEGVDPVDVENRAEVEVGGQVLLEPAGGATMPTLDLTARVGADLQLVQPLAASVFTQMAGRAELDLRVEGPADDPQLAGTATVETANLVPRSSVVGSQLELERPLRLVIAPMPADAPPMGVCRGRDAPRDRALPFGAFTVALDPQSPPIRIVRDESPVVIDRLELEFRRFAPDRIRLRLGAEDLALNVPRTLRGTFDVDGLQVELCQHVEAVGPARMRLMIGPGDVQVLRGEYIADITSASEINRGLADNLRGAAATRSVSVFERVPLLQQLYFDRLRAKGDGDFYVRNQITVLTLDLELRFTFDRIQGLLTRRTGDEQLRLDGEMSILADSQLIYARRPFEVTRGDVVFGQNSVLDAEVEATHTFRIRSDESVGTSTAFDRGGGDVRLEEVTLRASYRLPDWESPADLDIEMSSNSGLSSYEIAVLVLTGSLPDTLGGVASAQPATEMLLGPLLGLIERPLEDTLDVDLSLTPASTGTLFIDADKLLSRRLRLYSRTLVGDEDGSIPQTFGLEYRINNAATAELTNESAGNLNSTSGRLRLRFELD